MDFIIKEDKKMNKEKLNAEDVIKMLEIVTGKVEKYLLGDS